MENGFLLKSSEDFTSGVLTKGMTLMIQNQSHVPSRIDVGQPRDLRKSSVILDVVVGWNLSKDKVCAGLIARKNGPISSFAFCVWPTPPRGEGL
jgi:hypothetical protein